MESFKMSDKLFTKKIPGKGGRPDEQQFREWIWEKAAEVKVFDQIDTISDWKLVKDKIHKYPLKYRRISWENYFIRIAALLILTFGLSFGFYRLLLVHKSSGTGFTAYSADQHKKDVILPDGSTVSLNTGSDITFRDGFGSASRDVILNGEAYFHVIPGSALPFRVFSGESVVEVTGTRFTVSQVDGVVRVAVISGKVMLSSADDLPKKISISANQSGYLSENNEIILEDGIPANVLSWKTGHLIFEQTPIDSALIDIAHHFRRDLNIESDLTERITAEFQDQPLHEILDELILVAGLSFDTTGTALIVRK